MLDFTQEEKDFFMSEALKEAEKSLDKAEIPIGCVIVKDGEVIGRGHNAREELNQAIMHAEVMAIQEANRTEGNWRLLDCTLFVTIEPCVMCSGAIDKARIHKIKKEARKIDKSIVIEPETLECLLLYHCKNNIKQLVNDISSACSHAFLKNLDNNSNVYVYLDDFPIYVK